MVVVEEEMVVVLMVNVNIKHTGVEISTPVYFELLKKNIPMKTDKIISDATNNKIFRLTIFITENCNFNCIYCYEEHKKEKINRIKLNAIKILLSNRVKSLSRLEIDFFGGEPLLCNKEILELCSFICDLQKDYDFKFFGSMTTNAYLLKKEVIKELISNGVKSYQITLDGDMTMHNKTRILKNGKGTFQHIWNNLLELKKVNLSFNVILRIHLSCKNLKSVEVLIDKINSELLDDRRFKVFFKPIAKLGSQNDKSLEVIEFNRQEEVINKLAKKLKVPKQEFRFSDDYVCYASKLNSLCIRADGEIVKCTVALKEDYNKVGKLNNDGTIDLSRNKFLKWSNGLQSMNKNELMCPKKYLFDHNSN